MTPGGAKLPRGLGRQLAERDADFHAELATSRTVSSTGLNFGVVLRHALPRRAHAEARAAVGPGALRRGQDRRQRRQRLLLQAGVVMGALGAVGAVLAAAAGLDAHQRAELHLVLRPVGAIGLARLLDQVEERQVVKGAEGGQVVSRHEAPTLARKAFRWQGGRRLRPAAARGCRASSACFP